MSKKFNKVKDFYDQGFWTIEMVGNSVAKGWITEEEYLEKPVKNTQVLEKAEILRNLSTIE